MLKVTIIKFDANDADRLTAHLALFRASAYAFTKVK